MSLAQITNGYANKNITIKAEEGIFETLTINNLKTNQLTLTSNAGI